MIRRFNYTNRMRIRQRDVQITFREADRELSFDADLTALGGYGLPPDSLVFVEAYRQTNWMRFAFGQVGEILPPQDRVLRQFDSPDGVLFRVKVTAHGDIHTLLAEADRIRLAHSKQEPSKRSPLLPVKPQRLGDEIYRVDFSGAEPLLLINSDAGNYAAMGLSPQFMSLVYPAVFREVLTRVLLVEQHNDEDDPEDWRSHWIRFAKLRPGLGELPASDDAEAQRDWIDRAASAFAKQLQARQRFAEFWEGGA